MALRRVAFPQEAPLPPSLQVSCSLPIITLRTIHIDFPLCEVSLSDSAQLIYGPYTANLRQKTTSARGDPAWTCFSLEMSSGERTVRACHLGIQATFGIHPNT